MLLCAGGAGGCFFSADYSSGNFTCTDDLCPANFVCVANRCEPLRDGGTPDDAAVDAIDARIPAFTCADPGVVPATGGTEAGTTVGRANTVSSMCGGFVFNGADAVYKIDLPASKTVLVGIQGGRKAYVIAACQVSPATPACLGNMPATTGNPISVMPAAGPSFIVVDDENPANTSTYTLTVTVD